MSVPADLTAAAQLESLRARIEAAPLTHAADLEAYRLDFLSRQGALQAHMGLLKTAPPEERRSLGQQLNALKELAQGRFDQAQTALEESAAARRRADAAIGPDLTLPPLPSMPGSRHPVAQVRHEMLEILRRMGFALATGPEIERDALNFSALNFAVDHPAREMQDTFFIRRGGDGGGAHPDDLLLRTHTSPVQIRVMQQRRPPLRIVSPGRVYRNEAISARAHCFFHQIEGLYVDRDVSLRDLRATLDHFVRELFGAGVKVRMRPSYFPFTEPSAEVDITCLLCSGKGCTVCKKTGWLEIGGAGMVHPNVLAGVLKAHGLDPDEYSGFAFGVGLERTAMLLSGTRDLRWFSENDTRFLAQFAGA